MTVGDGVCDLRTYFLENTRECMRSGRQLGGLPSRAAAGSVRTTRDGFLSYLRSKGAWLGDVERHPVCLGVPLGVTGSSGRTVAVDLGLKSPAAMPLRELAACSPYVERALIKHALAPGPAELCATPPCPASDYPPFAPTHPLTELTLAIHHRTRSPVLRCRPLQA